MKLGTSAKDALGWKIYTEDEQSVSRIYEFVAPGYTINGSANGTINVPGSLTGMNFYSGSTGMIVLV